jgi:hypothetical protein
MDTVSRLIIKRGQGVPTVPVSSDHRNGDWLANDIYSGEYYRDTLTGVFYTRHDNQILVLQTIAATSGIQEVAKTLSAAQIRTWFTSPVDLGITAISGKHIEIVSASLKFLYGTIAFDGVTSDARLRSISAISPQMRTGAVINQVVNTFSRFETEASSLNSLVANEVMTISGGTDSSVGDGTAIIYATYRYI